MKRHNTFVRICISSFLFIFLFLSVAYIQKRYDSLMKLDVFKVQPLQKFVIPYKTLSYFHFGFQNVLADTYWIAIIQDFPEWDRSNNVLVEEYENLIHLDPHFEYPYLFGLLTVPVKTIPSSIDLMRPIGEFGIIHNENNWEIPFYLGTEYFFVQKSREKAFPYIQIANTRPAAPNMVHYTYASFVKKLDKESSLARSLIQTMYETTTSSTTKNILREGIEINDLTIILEKSVEIYKGKYHVYPKSVDDLVRTGIIVMDPGLQMKYSMSIDSTTGIVEVGVR